MNKLFVLEAGSRILLISAAIAMIVLALTIQWWAFMCLIPVAIAMGGITYCRIKDLDE